MSKVITIKRISNKRKTTSSNKKDIVLNNDDTVNGQNSKIFELDTDIDIFQFRNDIPDTLQITYKDDINIFVIHDIIRTKFSHERCMLDTYKENIIQNKEFINNVKSINEIRKIEKENKKLQEKIDDIVLSKSWNNYIGKCKEYLDDYTQVSTEKTKGVITIGKKIETEEDKIKTELRLKIINNYIRIAADYITLNISQQERICAECPQCGTLFKDFEKDEEDSIFLCSKCGWFRSNLAKSSNNNENGKISSGVKNVYEDCDNFRRAAIRFACKQVKNFHEKLFDDLDDYFIKEGYKSGEEIRKQPLNKNGKKNDVGFQLMLDALTFLSSDKKHPYRTIYSSYYEDIWLIMHNYWGFKANNIEHLLPRLIAMYYATQEVYNNMTSEEKGGRDAALNTQIRLLLQLLSCDYECDKTDFKLPKCRNSIQIQQTSWKIMCKRAKVKFVPII